AAAAEALGSGTYAKAVRDEQNAFRQMEVSGVPTFILNQRHMMIGAQPPEMFEKALRRLGVGASGVAH
ncbi:MAG: DsbA family protein, partial [Pseudomonadota bacterium]